MAKDLWVEKYRPSSVDTYVFKDNAQRKQVQNGRDDGGIPLLFSGSPGTGKTTQQKFIAELGVENADVLYIMQRDNGVDMILRKLVIRETMLGANLKLFYLTRLTIFQKDKRHYVV